MVQGDEVQLLETVTLSTCSTPAELLATDPTNMGAGKFWLMSTIVTSIGFTKELGALILAVVLDAVAACTLIVTGAMLVIAS